MSSIFISYSRKDTDFREKLDVSLVKKGFTTWVDEKMPLGRWSDHVQDGLDKCNAMLLIVSPDSMKSQNVKDEWEYFLSTEKPLIPIIWKKSKMHYRLNSLDFIEFDTQGEYEVALRKLVDKLKLVGIEPNPPRKTTFNQSKTGNLFWLCHDMMELFRWIGSGVQKQWIDIGLRQSLHHATELELDEHILNQLKELIQRTTPLQEADWANLEQRALYANQVKIIFNMIAQLVQSADPNFNSGPG